MCDYPFFIPQVVLFANSSLFWFKVTNEHREFRNYLLLYGLIPQILAVPFHVLFYLHFPDLLIRTGDGIRICRMVRQPGSAVGRLWWSSGRWSGARWRWDLKWFLKIRWFKAGSSAVPLCRRWRSGCRGWWRSGGQLVWLRGTRNIWMFCWRWRMRRGIRWTIPAEKNAVRDWM